MKTLHVFLQKSWQNCILCKTLQLSSFQIHMIIMITHHPCSCSPGGSLGSCGRETDYSDPFDARPDPRPRPGWEQSAIEACSSYMEPFEAQRFISGTAVPHWISYNTKESIYSAAVIPVVSFVVWTVLCGNLVYVNWSLTTPVLIHFHNTHT